MTTINKSNHPDYILNPETNKYVLKTGAIGRKLLKDVQSHENLELSSDQSRNSNNSRSKSNNKNPNSPNNPNNPNLKQGEILVCIRLIDNRGQVISETSFVEKESSMIQANENDIGINLQQLSQTLDQIDQLVHPKIIKPTPLRFKPLNMNKPDDISERSLTPKERSTPKEQINPKEPERSTPKEQSTPKEPVKQTEVKQTVPAKQTEPLKTEIKYVPTTATLRSVLERELQNFSESEDTETAINHVKKEVIESIQPTKLSFKPINKPTNELTNKTTNEKTNELPKSKQDTEITIYTDGAVSNNHKASSAYGGIGVFFGENDPRNISEKFSQGKVTNQRAELYAVIRACQSVISSKDEKRPIKIYTDSLYAMNILSKKWSAKDNLDLVKIGRGLLDQIPKAKLIHVRAHTGKSDPQSFGNSMADRLAVQGKSR